MTGTIAAPTTPVADAPAERVRWSRPALVVVAGARPGRARDPDLDHDEPHRRHRLRRGDHRSHGAAPPRRRVPRVHVAVELPGDDRHVPGGAQLQAAGHEPLRARASVRPDVGGGSGVRLAHRHPLPPPVPSRLRRARVLAVAGTGGVDRHQAVALLRADAPPRRRRDAVRGARGGTSAALGRLVRRGPDGGRGVVDLAERHVLRRARGTLVADLPLAFAVAARLADDSLRAARRVAVDLERRELRLQLARDARRARDVPRPSRLLLHARAPGRAGDPRALHRVRGSSAPPTSFSTRSSWDCSVSRCGSGCASGRSPRSRS